MIVAPGTEVPDRVAEAVGLALGKFLSDAISNDMTIGVGWGRTLSAALASFRPPSRTGIKVMSLLGGSVETRFANPASPGLSKNEGRLPGRGSRSASVCAACSAAVHTKRFLIGQRGLKAGGWI